MRELTHVDERGGVKMVEVGHKEEVFRKAVARGRIRLRPETIELIKSGRTKKGNVIAAAQIAGILAVKRTPELIPLCHPIPLTGVDVTFEFGEDYIEATCEVRAHYKTGVEMEALTGVSVALLTVWDMVKAVEKDENGQYPFTRIEDIRVVEKVKELTPGSSKGEVLEDLFHVRQEKAEEEHQERGKGGVAPQVHPDKPQYGSPDQCHGRARQEHCPLRCLLQEDAPEPAFISNHVPLRSLPVLFLDGFRVPREKRSSIELQDVDVIPPIARGEEGIDGQPGGVEFSRQRANMGPPLSFEGSYYSLRLKLLEVNNRNAVPGGF